MSCPERARKVAHVPRILYHWRMLATSAAGGGEAAKPWAFEAGKRAVQAHCDRVGFPAQVERDPEDPGVLHLEPRLRSEGDSTSLAWVYGRVAGPDRPRGARDGG